VVAIGVVLGGAVAFAVQRAVAARRLPRRTGWEELVGQVAVVRQPLAPLGQVWLEGGLWAARLRADGSDGEAPIGSRVRVESVEGLTLQVRPVTGVGDEREGAAASANPSKEGAE
jgi:membrane-bound serine protease (ClpP class)